jgi:hypothetical protein
MVWGLPAGWVGSWVLVRLIWLAVLDDADTHLDGHLLADGIPGPFVHTCDRVKNSHL